MIKDPPQFLPRLRDRDTNGISKQRAVQREAHVNTFCSKKFSSTCIQRQSVIVADSFRRRNSEIRDTRLKNEPRRTVRKSEGTSKSEKRKTSI